MAEVHRPITIATRGSALALAQANYVLSVCRERFPAWSFQIKIIKTTGDKLQTAALANPDASTTKGLFTKELELALLNQEADLAVHSLKDLPTDLPAGLHLGAVCRRADPRDVLVYRDARYLQAHQGSLTGTGSTEGHSASAKRGFGPGLSLSDLPQGATIATSSTRRQAQLLDLRPDLKTVPIRGNVPTRLRKISDLSEIDATILAIAGLERLHYRVDADSQLRAVAPPTPAPTAGELLKSKTDTLFKPAGLLASLLPPELMLPCVGQAAIGIEVRQGDKDIAPVCEALDHYITHQCVIAERAFLHAMGGGCQSPVAGYAMVVKDAIHLRAVSFRNGPARHAQATRPITESAQLGEAVAAELL